ncbi:hypothetical protein FGLOB1_4987 [Fusarium globosum]|uniref:Uncharacterized protein n=1 Tax=Fusarium globosum TaxID=78864 RepID=A0A8H5YG64_9HYPO|nr:hypothetical protein FGLOB1_4987 [Fusarium globosum]
MDSKSEKSAEHFTSEDMDCQVSSIQPVKAALAKAKKRSQRNAPSFRGLEEKTYNLFSTDHVKHCWHTITSAKYIEFYPPEDWDPFLNYTDGRGPVEGHVYLVTDQFCSLDLFTPPKYPSTKFHKLKANKGRKTVDVQFLDDYFLILRIHRDFVFSTQSREIPKEAPEFFTYYGIAEGYTPPVDKREEKAKRRRSASPQ